MNEPGTAVTRGARVLPADVQRTIEENRMRNAVVAQIRGTIWGKDLNPEQVRAVAQYAREVGIDPVRHVEVLGGRIYLTADFYQERGASLIRRGEIILHPTEYIHADPRLDEVAAKMTGEAKEWALGEQLKRLQARIQYGVPEKAAAAAVVRLTVRSTGATFVGVSWCGGGSRQRDPVGDSEPTKTAETRAARRAWKRIVSVVPEMQEQVETVEARAVVVQDELVEQAASEVKALPRTTMLAGQDEPHEPMPETPMTPMESDPYGEDAA